MIQGTPIRAYPNRDDVVIFPVEDVFAMRNLSLGAVTRCVIICRKDGQQDVIIDSNSVPAAFDFLATSVINGRKVYAIHWNPGVSIPGLFPEKGLWMCDAYLYDVIHQKGMFVRTFPLQVMGLAKDPIIIAGNGFYGDKGYVAGDSEFPVFSIDPGAFSGSLQGGLILKQLWHDTAFGGNGLYLVIQGPSGVPLQNVFTSLTFTDQLGDPHTFLSASATYSAGTAQARWTWVANTFQYFNTGDSYELTFVY